MIFIRILALSLVATGLASCGPKLAELAPSNFAAYDVETTKLPDAATIKGTFTKGSWLGATSKSTDIAAIDGKVAFKEAKVTDPVPLAPGLHSLALSAWMGGYHVIVPATIDAKPHASYVVQAEKGDLTLGNYLRQGAPTYLYIVDEKTGAVVVPKIPDHMDEVTEFYVEPGGSNVASIRGTVDNGLLDKFSAYVLAIDGKYVPRAPDTLLTDSSPSYAASFRLTPGLHSVGIGIRAANGWGVFPILLDAKPGAAYVARFEQGFKRNGTSKWQTFTVWLEEEKTAAIIVPKTDVPVTRLPF